VKMLTSMLQHKTRSRDFLESSMTDNFRKLQELTGTNEYPSTRTMPPIILGVEYAPLPQYYCFYASYD
jgi:hypothetical protein